MWLCRWTKFPELAGADIAPDLRSLHRQVSPRAGAARDGAGGGPAGVFRRGGRPPQRRCGSRTSTHTSRWSLVGNG
ncbi:hypothetical protein [Ornithinimicrobium kibberense]|uniref:hypothetical protein n=1 Tax=Ornithinimicrobium kibberense TaxID=282060 RepID=UPI0036215956